MGDLPAILILMLAAAAFVGAGLFFRVTSRRGAGAAGALWLLCAVVLIAVMWTTRTLGTSPKLLVFVGLILPVWLLAGGGGIMLSVLRGRAGK